MINNLPTTPGQHWFKEEGTDNWQPYYVTTLDGEGLICHCSEYNVTSRCLVSEMPGGQWAKAHKPDDGQEAFAVRCPNGQFTYISTEDDCDKQCEHLNETDMFLDGQEYDVVPVTIYRKKKE